mgnify:CR=1 FL=1
MRDLLQAQGHDAGILALHIDDDMRGDVRPFADGGASAGDVTIRRMYLETMGRLVPKLGRKVVVDEQARSVLPLLQLDAAASPKAKEVKP